MLQVEGVRRGELGFYSCISSFSRSFISRSFIPRSLIRRSFIRRSLTFCRAMASAVSATSMPRTGNPSAAMCSAFSPVPQPASSTAPENPPSEARRTIAGCGRPISHGAGPLLSVYDASMDAGPPPAAVKSPHGASCLFSIAHSPEFLWRTLARGLLYRRALDDPRKLRS